MTNFERITESPEKLATFIDEYYGICPGSCGRCYMGMDFCFKKPRLDEPIGKAFVDWLKEESEMRRVNHDQKETEKETEKATEKAKVVSRAMGQ